MSPSKKLCLAISPPILLVTPVLATLLNLSVSPFSGGAIAVLLVVGMVGLGLGVLAMAVIGRGQFWSILSAASLATTFLLFVDTAFDGRTILEFFSINFFFTVVSSFLCFIGLTVLFYLIQEFAVVPIFVLALTTFLLMLVEYGAQAQAREAGAPLIYIVLDEMIGLNGIDDTIPGAKEARNEVQNVFLRNGFLIYENAYSRNYFSNRSIPAALNFDWQDNEPGNVSRYSIEGDKDAFRNIALFSKKKSEGYQIDVWQSDHMNFCLATKVNCFTYPSFNPNSNYYSMPGGNLIGPIKIIQESYRNTFFLFYVSKQLASVITGGKLRWIPKNFDAHGFPAWFDSFQAHLVQSTAGRKLTFAHFLMPHSPHVLDENCIEVRLVDNPYDLTARRGLTGDEFSAARAKFYSQYFQQVRCLAKKLDGLFQALDERSEFSDASIILHGDHGSRISAGRFREDLSQRDLIDNYSTFFAIRTPMSTEGISPRHVSVERLVSEYLNAQAELLAPEDGTIVVDSKEGHAVVIKMPNPADND